MSLLCSTAEKVHNQDLSVLATKVEKDPLNCMDCESETFVEKLIPRDKFSSQRCCFTPADSLSLQIYIRFDPEDVGGYGAPSCGYPASCVVSTSFPQIVSSVSGPGGR